MPVCRRGCCNMFRGPQLGRELVASGVVKTIAFTGSKDVGLGIMQSGCGSTAGQRVVKRVIAEMAEKMPSSSMRRLISMKP